MDPNRSAGTVTRTTANSHDIVLDDVFVAEAQVIARRTWSELDRMLLVASLHAGPVIYATYLGIAEGLIGAVLASGKIGAGAARLLGQADSQLRVARWALEGVLADLGDDPDPTVDNLVALQQMKRAVTVAARTSPPWPPSSPAAGDVRTSCSPSSRASTR